MDIFYATHDGQSAKIAIYLAELLRTYGVVAEARNLLLDFPCDSDLINTDPCVLIAPIRYGFHLPIARKLLKRIAPLTPRKPVVLLSINLTARKKGKQSASTNVYLRKWIKRSGVKPVLAEALGGRLDYPRYGWFDKLMIRLIMTITGGPTDPAAIVDYTPWNRIDDLADEIVALVPAFEVACLSESALSAG